MLKLGLKVSPIIAVTMNMSSTDNIPAEFTTGQRVHLIEQHGQGGINGVVTSTFDENGAQVVRVEFSDGREGEYMNTELSALGVSDTRGVRVSAAVAEDVHGAENGHAELIAAVPARGGEIKTNLTSDARRELAAIADWVAEREDMHGEGIGSQSKRRAAVKLIHRLGFTY